MAFLETPRLPTRISYGSLGGPSFRTKVTAGFSGFESRVALWSAPRFNYQASAAIKTEAALYELLQFFLAVNGRRDGFRFQDRLDYRSSEPSVAISSLDQAVGVGDGATSTFQLLKTYAVGIQNFVRTISKPVLGTVVVALDGLPPVEAYAVDYATGIIDFGAFPPALDVVITAGYEFDVPVRFDTDDLPISLEFYKGGSANVPIVEIRI